MPSLSVRNELPDLVWRQFSDWHERCSKWGAERSTIRQYRHHTSLHILPRLGRTKLSDLSPATVERSRDDLLKSLSRPMAKKVLTSFKSLLRAAKHAHVADDVAVKRSPRDKRALEVGRDIPTPNQIKRMGGA